MTKSKSTTQPADDQNNSEKKHTLKQEKNDSSAQQALKKEKQPETGTDLSPIQNNKEIGTTGADQRASENELKHEKDPVKANSKKR